MAQLADQEHGSGGVNGKMQLLGADIDITREDVIHDDVLHKGAPVMAFLIKNLGVIQGHIGHEAHASCHLILTAGKHGILIVIAVTHNGLKGPPLKAHHGVQRATHLQGGLWPSLPQEARVAAGDDNPLRVHDTQNPVCGVF